MPVWITVGVLLLVLLTGALLILVVYLFWRNGYMRGWRQARTQPPLCLNCGYDLSGLTHCRCPECGHEYRLDQLWRKSVEVSRETNKAEEPSVEATQTHPLVAAFLAVAHRSRK